MLIEAEYVFVCGGAVQSPALLQRSGIWRNIGGGLKVHPTIKLAARFPETIGDHLDVPMHQIKEFAPDLTLGGSVSRPGHVAVALSDDWARNRVAMADWESIAVYYGAIRSDGHGRVTSVPGLPDPVVTYRLLPSDLSRLARGLVHLAELLFAAGAVELYPSVIGAPPLRDLHDVADLWTRVTPGAASLMTIHLFSSIGMGEDRGRTGTDSFGRVWDVENLRVNDASLVPDAPGVNPQGTIMAIAARNCDHFLEQR